jgi:hypothetical protein
MRARVSHEPLRTVSRNDRALAHWSGHDVKAVADQAREQLVGAGVCLPAVSLAGAVVVPVVGWDDHVLRTRLRSTLGAVLDRTTVRDRLEEGLDPEPAPLRILASIVLSRIGASWDGLAVQSPYGRVIACVPRRPRSWVLTECDYFGYTIVHVRQGGPETLVEGHRGARPGTMTTPVQGRLRQEQLFDVALRTDSLPLLEAVSCRC